MEKPSYLIPYIPGLDDRKEPGYSELSDEEKKRLTACEKEIAESLEAFYRVASRLYEINQDGLFREHYPTFASYCLDKLNLVPIPGARIVGPIRQGDDATDAYIKGFYYGRRNKWSREMDAFILSSHSHNATS